MNKTFTQLMFPVVLGAVLPFSLKADDCFTELFPGKNLMTDSEITSSSNFGGWGNKDVVNINDDSEAKVFCGETSGKVFGSNGGSLNYGITLNKNSYYRVKAKVYVESVGQFQIGGVNIGDLKQTSKVDEWEDLDFIFYTLNNNFIELYFNNYNRGGDVGYIDNWEIYEWPDENGLKQILSAVQKGFNFDIEGYSDLKTQYVDAEILSLNLSPDNIENVKSAINNLTALFNDYLTAEAINNSDVIINPDANDGNNGWNITGHINNPATNQYWTGESLPYFDGGQWGNPGWNFDFNQDLQNLPSGKYLLKIEGRASLDVDMSLYIKTYIDDLKESTAIKNLTSDVYGQIWDSADDGSDIKNVNGGIGRGWGYVYVVFDYLEGADMTIGVEASTPSQYQWLSFDNFNLYYLDEISPEATKDFVQKILDYANTIDDTKLFDDILIDFNNAKAVCAAAIQSGNVSDLENAYNVTRAALLNAKNIADLFLVLKQEIEYAETFLDTDYPGKEEFLAVIANAKGIYENMSASPAETVEELKAAVLAYRLSQDGSIDSPADFTFMIVNPSFETGDLTGWSCDGSGDTNAKPNSNATYATNGCDGDYVFNTWNNNSGSTITQEIDGLPEGYYVLTALYASDPDKTATLKLNDAETTMTADESGKGQFNRFATEKTKISDGKAVISTTSPDWYKTDDYKLNYLGLDGTTDISESITESLVVVYVVDNKVVVSGADKYSVITVDGKVISPKVELSKGIYYVMVKGKAYPVAIK